MRYRIRYRNPDTLEIGYSDWTTDIESAYRALQSYLDCGYDADVEARG